MKKTVAAFLLVIFLFSALASPAFATGSQTVTTSVPCTVTLQVGEHGKVIVEGAEYTGDASFQKNRDTVVTYTFAPKLFYSVDKVIYNGTEVTGSLSGDSFVAPPLTENASLSVSFKFIGGGTPTYLVTFDTNGHGTAPATQTVLSGNTAIKPTDPSASGWIFGGWYQEAACTTAFNFATPINNSLTLYAKWTKQSEGSSSSSWSGSSSSPLTYLVTFDVTADGTSLISQKVLSGDRVSQPSVPTLEKRTFEGWYTDAAFGDSFDFSSPITKDIILYGKWGKADGAGITGTSGSEPFVHSVTFDALGDGMTVEVQLVEEGKKAIKPTAPRAEGWVFEGWYEDSNYSKAFDFDKPIDGNVTLYGKWSKNGLTGIHYKPASDAVSFAQDEKAKPSHTKAKATSKASPQTGTKRHLILWLELSLLSAIGLAGLGVYNKKRKNRVR